MGVGMERGIQAHKEALSLPPPDPVGWTQVSCYKLQQLSGDHYLAWPGWCQERKV